MAYLNLNNAFREKAGKLWHELGDAIKTDCELWKEDLETAIDIIEKELTEDQRSTIVKNTSPTLSIMIGKENNSLSKPLTHAFIDSIEKSRYSISIMNVLKDDETLGALLSLKEILEDNIHNYSLLLDEELPATVLNILNKYENDIIPQIDTMIEELSKNSNINPNDITINTSKGNEHLGRLPDNIFE